jgi:hypothetical protein
MTTSKKTGSGRKKLTPEEREARRREVIAKREGASLTRASKRAMEHFHRYERRAAAIINKRETAKREIEGALLAGFPAYAKRIADRAGINVKFDMAATIDLVSGDVKTEFDEALQVDVSPDGRDRGTKEFQRKATLVDVNFKKSTLSAKRNLATTVWDEYFARDLITWRQHRAAELYLQSWHQSGMEPRLTGSYSDAGGGGSDPFYAMPHSTAQAHHRDLLRSYNRDIGPRLSSLVVHVVCMDRPAKTWNKATRTGPQIKANMELLREAFDRLADFLNLPEVREKGSDELDEPDA